MSEQKPNIKVTGTKVEAYMVQYHHDTDDCNGAMTHTGAVFDTNPPTFQIQCQACGALGQSDKAAGALEWRAVKVVKANPIDATH